MPTSTYTSLGTITLTSTDTEIVFASIPAGYRDLVLVFDYLPSGSGDQVLNLRFNSDTGNNYNEVVTFYANNSGLGSYANANVGRLELQYTSAVRNMGLVQIFDYSATDKQKSVLSKQGNTNTSGVFTSWQRVLAGRWANTNAISSIALQQMTFASGSTFSLYGIAG